MSQDRNGTGPAVAHPLPTDAAELEREIQERRDRLAATVDELATRARPSEIARRSITDFKQRLHNATTTPDGHLRVERVGAAGAAVLAVLLLAVLRRRRRRH